MHSPFRMQLIHHLQEGSLWFPPAITPTAACISDFLPLSVSLEKLLKSSIWVLFHCNMRIQHCFRNRPGARPDHCMESLVPVSLPQSEHHARHFTNIPSLSHLNRLRGRYHHLCFIDMKSWHSNFPKAICKQNLYPDQFDEHGSMAFSKDQWKTRRVYWEQQGRDWSELHTCETKRVCVHVCK